MTTIAYKDGVIATDGQATCGDVVDSLEATKMVESQGRFFFYSGSTAYIDEFVQAYPDGEVTKDTFTAAFVIDGGILWRAVEDGGGIVRWKNGSRPWAFGSGYQFALGAMKYGASAGDAILISSELDTGTGGVVRSYDALTGEEL